MFEFSLLSAAKEQRPASSCQSAIFGKFGKNSLNLAGMILHNSVYNSTTNLPRGQIHLPGPPYVAGCPLSQMRKTADALKGDNVGHQEDVVVGIYPAMRNLILARNWLCFYDKGKRPSCMHLGAAEY